MTRSMNTIKGVTSDELNNYNPEAFDAVPQPDGTFDLVPVRWMNESEYNEVEYGCGIYPESDDNDPNNPVDMNADDWREVYSRMDDPTDYIDHDHSMDY